MTEDLKVKRAITEYELTPTTRAKLRLDAKRHGQDATGKTDTDLVAMYEANHGTEPDFRDGDRLPGEGGSEGGSEEQPSTPPPTPPGATDNPLDSHIRKIAREEIAYHKATDEHAPKVDIDKIIAEVAKRTHKTITVEVKREDAPTIKVEGAHEKLATVLKMAAAKVNVYLVGPAGCGKTTLVEQAAAALGAEFDLSGAVNQEHKLLGYLDPHGKYVETAFYRAFKNGYTFLFDEIDGGSSSALLTINAALANGFADFPCGKVLRHPNFVAIAAANTYGRGADREYVGRTQLDGASLDRFMFVTMNYDEAREAEWAAQHSGYAGAAEWTATVQRYRHAKDALKVRHIISPRASIDGAKLLAQGLTQAEVEDMAIWKGLDAATVAKIKASA